MGAEHFWSDNVSEPKRSYNWVMEFNQIPVWMLKTATKPNFTVTESTTNFLGHTFYHPARVEWQAIDVTLGDPVQPDAAASMVYLLRQMGYDYPDGLAYANGVGNQGPTGISKKRSVAAMGDTSITQLSAEGGELEKWELINPFITKAEFGSLDYASDDMVEVSITIRYDFAILTHKDASRRIAGSFNKGGPIARPRADGTGGGNI